MQLDLTTKPIAQKAYYLASAHHRGINRKFTGEPYITHPVRVAENLLKHGIIDDRVLAAALLHDCMEDEDVSGVKMRWEAIADRCGSQVANWVEALTAPARGRNRPERKRLYNEQLSRSPWQVKAIKFADIIDNITGIHELDPDFAETYIAEKNVQLRFIEIGAPTNIHPIRNAASNAVQYEAQQFGLRLVALAEAHQADLEAENAAFEALVNEMVDLELPRYAVF